MADPDKADLQRMAEELRRQAEDLAKTVRRAFEDVAENAQVEAEKAGAKFAAAYPDLYAELRKTGKQLERTARQAAKDFGLAGGQSDDRKRSSK
ncbi:MAG: hypothetical protein QOD77_1777 [Thermoplasmata archaeon]|jgi:uncharacterized protein YukE|nr:hypothetical protein [Thermoplasmata archaeon]